MDDDTARAVATNRLRPARGLGARLAVVGLLAAVGLLAVACDGTTGSGAAGAGGTTTTVAPSGSSTTTAATSSSSEPGSAEEATLTEQLQFAHCMRSKGVPNFPDPSATGGLLNAISAAGINTKSPAYQEALQACRQYNPGANLTPAQSAADTAKGVEYAQCMRSHGVPNFPDPIVGPTGGQAINLRGLGIDQNSPTYQAANQACQSIIPSGK